MALVLTPTPTPGEWKGLIQVLVGAGREGWTCTLFSLQYFQKLIYTAEYTEVPV